jgi:hypothetical protein
MKGAPTTTTTRRKLSMALRTTAVSYAVLAAIVILLFHISLEKVTEMRRTYRQKGKNTMNLLLEWGQLDLGMTIRSRSPPVFPKEILTFWEALSEVANAVSGIHEFKAGGNEFNG